LIREENLRRYERWAAKPPPFKVGDTVVYKGGKQEIGLVNGMIGKVRTVGPPIKPSPNSMVHFLNRSNSLAGWSVEVIWPEGGGNHYPAAWFRLPLLDELSRL